jgi:hypothetical protein
MKCKFRKTFVLIFLQIAGRYGAGVLRFNDLIAGQKFRRMARVAALPYKIAIAEI